MNRLTRAGCRLTIGLSIAVAANGVMTQTAYALPGQPIAQTVQWSKNHPLIGKLLLQTKYGDSADYIAEGETAAANFSLNIFLDKASRVDIEIIDYRPKPNQPAPLSFERANHNGLLLLEQVYGKALADDFRTAKYVRKVKDNASWDNYFYLGKKYAYGCMNNPSDKIHHFTLIKKENLQKYIQTMIDYSDDPDAGV